MRNLRISRRQLIAGAASFAVGRAFAAEPPAAPVAVARCTSYDKAMFETLARLMDQIGGIGGLVKGKTVAVKLNLTGNPDRFPERPDMPYRNHDLATALVRQGVQIHHEVARQHGAVGQLGSPQQSIQIETAARR